MSSFWPPVSLYTWSRNLRISATACCASSILPILAPTPFAAQPEMRLQNLTDVHARRHAQRIQHDVDRRAVRHVRHVLDRNDGGDHALVAVTARHLVAGLHAALHRQVHLDHLEHARRQIVARGDLGLLLLEALLERLALALQPLGHGLELRIRLLVLEADLEPLLARQIGEVRLVDLRAGLEPLRARSRRPCPRSCRARAGTSRPRGCAAGRPSPCGPARARPSRSPARASPSRRRRG